MKKKKFLIFAISVMSMFLFSSIALAALGTNILYEEIDLGGGLWQYDYTYYNTSTVGEYLFAVDLLLAQWATVDWLNIPTGWDSSLWGFTPIGTDFIDTYSTDPAYDIAAGNSLDSFSFTVDYRAGDISYTAYFDDGTGGISDISGVTGVFPEPVSSILFVTGATVLGFRRFMKKMAT